MWCVILYLSLEPVQKMYKKLFLYLRDAGLGCVGHANEELSYS